MDNRRLILLLVFSFSLVMLWDAWQQYNKPKLPPALTTAVQTDGTAPRPTVDLQAASSALPVAAAAPLASKAETVSVKTDLFTVDVSALGGDIVHLDLNHYKAIEEKEKEAFTVRAEASVSGAERFDWRRFAQSQDDVFDRAGQARAWC